MRETIGFFERKGKARLLADYYDRPWYRDFLDFIKREKIFAQLLTPTNYGPDTNYRWDTWRNCEFNELLGFYGINHNGNIFPSYSHFRKEAPKIDEYLTKWEAVGFRAPSMYHNLNWVGELNIEYDSSTFDTDPFEPQPDGVGTIFPFWVSRNRELATRNSDPVTGLHSGYVELPYTLPQDFTLFILMKEKNTDIWAKKLNWIVEFGGMVLLNTHPDYMNFDGGKNKLGEYPKEYYEDFLAQINLK